MTPSNPYKHNLSHAYRHYSKQPGAVKNSKLFKTVVQLFLKFLSEKMLAGEIIRLPMRMGEVFVKGMKQNLEIIDGQIKGLAIDWKETRKLWKSCLECAENKQKVYHLNEHTGGFRYKIWWSRRYVLVENRDAYVLHFTRNNKRTLAKLIKSGKEY